MRVKRLELFVQTSTSSSSGRHRATTPGAIFPNYSYYDSDYLSEFINPNDKDKQRLHYTLTSSEQKILDTQSIVKTYYRETGGTLGDRDEYYSMLIIAENHPWFNIDILDYIFVKVHKLTQGDSTFDLGEVGVKV